MSEDMAALRVEYARQSLSESDVFPDPLEQFRLWFEQAVASQLHEPNGMTLATATTDGVPSARVVLLKAFDARGFVFYTNHESRKGREMAANPHVALTFWWAELERQVRIEGLVSHVSDAEADAYFRTRPLEAQIGAWASQQSTVLPTRQVLEERVTAVVAHYAGNPPPRPPFWGGYRVAPQVVEFWQGRLHRLHDRIRYRRQGEGWVIERLSP